MMSFSGVADSERESKRAAPFSCGSSPRAPVSAEGWAGKVEARQVEQCSRCDRVLIASRVS